MWERAAEERPAGEPAGEYLEAFLMAMIGNRERALDLALDQIRTIDKRRVSRKAGKASPKVVGAMKAVIQEMLVL